MSNLFLSTIVFLTLSFGLLTLNCQSKIDKVVKSDYSFDLKYNRTPFSFNFEINPAELDAAYPPNSNCSFKLFKKANIHDIIAISDDCFLNHVYNVEPKTEYRLELELNYKGIVSSRYAELKSDSLDFEVKNFGMKSVEYSSNHSYFYENKNEQCQVYDNDSGDKLRCGDNLECNCQSDIITNLESGKKYVIKIVNKNYNTTLDHLVIKTMMKPENRIEKDEKSLTINFSYEDLVKTPNSCKLFVINDKNFNEALVTDFLDGQFKPQHATMYETNCQSVSNITLGDKEKSPNYLLLIDKFNHKVDLLTLIGQGSNFVTIIEISPAGATYQYSDDRGLTPDNICFPFITPTRQVLGCSVPNRNGFNCTCIGPVKIVDLEELTSYTISFAVEDGPVSSSYDIYTPELGRVSILRTGLEYIQFAVDKTSPNLKLTNDCHVCIFPRGLRQHVCCDRGVIKKVQSPNCDGTVIDNIGSNLILSMQGCSFQGSVWFKPVDTSTRSRPSISDVEIRSNSIYYSFIYAPNFPPDECFVFVYGIYARPETCLLQTGCDCYTGEYPLSSTPPVENPLVIYDREGVVVFPQSGFIAPTDPNSPNSSQSIFGGLNVGEIIGIAIGSLAGVAVISTILFFIIRRARRKSRARNMFNLQSDDGMRRY